MEFMRQFPTAGLVATGVTGVGSFYEADGTHSHAFVDYISRNVLHTPCVSG